MANPTYIFTTDWFSPNIPVWNEFLKPYRDIPVKALEIGSFQGRSTTWLLDNILTHTESSITCVDTFEGSEEHNDDDLKDLFSIFTHNVQRFGDKVKINRGKSGDVIRTMVRIETYDIIYVDGDHHAVSVLEDAVLSFPLLKKGGIMIFDDYTWPGGNDPWDRPGISIDAFVSIHKKELEVIYNGYQLMIKKL